MLALLAQPILAVVREAAPSAVLAAGGQNGSLAHDASPSCDAQLAALAARPASGSMDDMTTLLAKLATGAPFGFVHFNDGEIRAATASRGSTDWGCQTLSPQLQASMARAMGARHEALYKGLPCEREFGDLRRRALELVGGDGSARNATSPAPPHQLTAATLFLNGNYRLARELLPPLLRRRRERRGGAVHLLVSEAADVSEWARRTAIAPATVLRVPSKEAFSKAYAEHRDAWRRFAPGDVVIACAGPVGRVLASEWFVRQPLSTVLELGSFFDPDFALDAVANTRCNHDHFTDYHKGNWAPDCKFEGDRRADASTLLDARRCLSGLP